MATGATAVGHHFFAAFFAGFFAADFFALEAFFAILAEVGGKVDMEKKLAVDAHIHTSILCGSTAVRPCATATLSDPLHNAAVHHVLPGNVHAQGRMGAASASF